MVWQVVWHDTRISDAPACSEYLFASNRLRKHRILPVMIAFEADVVVVLERAPAADRDGWRRRLLVARSHHDRRERPNGPRVARACRSAASATSRSTGNAHAQESEQGVLAVKFCHDSRCKNSRR